MSALKWVAGGAVGAAIGGAIWIAVGYFLEAEVGYIAWAIGLFAGIGVRVTADSDVGFGPGGIAVICAVLAVLGSKYLVVSLLVDNAFASPDVMSDFQISEQDMVVRLADDVAEEFESAGKKLRWPNEMTMEDASTEQDYPRDVWSEARKRYDAQSAEEKAENLKVAQEEMAQFAQLFQETLGGSVKDEAFRESFAPFDLLWFGLAAFTAFRVGSGMAGDD